MGLQDVAPSIEAHNRALVMADTWGHLYPKPRVIYPGWMVFTIGTYGDNTIVDFDFKDLPASPWLYEDLHDFTIAHAQRGELCRFDGTYTKFKNGGYRLSGKVRLVWRAGLRFRNRGSHLRLFKVELKKDGL